MLNNASHGDGYYIAAAPPFRNRACLAALQVQNRNGVQVVTCYLKYVIVPYKAAESKRYSKMWIPLVKKIGG